MSSSRSNCWNGSVEKGWIGGPCSRSTAEHRLTEAAYMAGRKIRWPLIRLSNGLLQFGTQQSRTSPGPQDDSPHHSGRLGYKNLTFLFSDTPQNRGKTR